MLSYMLPTEDKPPPGDSNQANYRASKLQKSLRERPPIATKPTGKIITVSPKKYVDTGKTMIVSTKIEEHAGDQQQHHRQDEQQQHGVSAESPKHNGTVVRKSTLHTSKVTKDDSLYSINSEASTVGSDRKNKIFNGAKHTSLKRKNSAGRRCGGCNVHTSAVSMALAIKRKRRSQRVVSLSRWNVWKY